MSGSGKVQSVNIRSEKCLVGEMSSRIMSSRGNNCWGKCLVGEMSSRGSVGRELSSRGCVNRGNVGRGNVQSGNCSRIVANMFPHYWVLLEWSWRCIQKTVKGLRQSPCEKHRTQNTILNKLTSCSPDSNKASLLRRGLGANIFMLENASKIKGRCITVLCPQLK